MQKHHILFFFLVMIMVAFTSCVTMGGSKNSTATPGLKTYQVGDIMDWQKKQKISFKKLMDEITSAKVVYIGETHVSFEDHRIEREILAGLYDKHPSLILAMEMFPREVQPILDKWIHGSINDDAFLHEVQWEKIWGYPFQFYSPLLHFIRERHLELIGLNAPPEIVRKISSKGFPSLSREERNRVAAKINFANPKHREFIRKQYEEHPRDNIKNFEAFYAAQLTWEETMAETLATQITSHPGSEKFIVIIGKGHIEHGFGVPQRTWRRVKHTYKIVFPLSITEVDKVDDKDIADYIWVTKKEAGFRHPHLLGIMVKPLSIQRGIKVSKVLPKSAAAEAGIEAGDIILTIDTTPIKSIKDIHRAMLSVKRVHRLSIQRASEKITVTVTLPKEKP